MGIHSLGRTYLFFIQRESLDILQFNQSTKRIKNTVGFMGNFVKVYKHLVMFRQFDILVLKLDCLHPFEFDMFCIYSYFKWLSAILHTKNKCYCQIATVWLWMSNCCNLALYQMIGKVSWWQGGVKEASSKWRCSLKKPIHN